MIEFAKSFLMMVGTITTALVLTYFVLKLEEKFKSWRKNGCKFKCLCKHEYDFEFVNKFRRYALLKCRKCEPFCYSMPLTDTYIKLNEMEVVGNVFDNPELLEEENVHGTD